MPTDNDRVSTLVFLGTDTIYSPTSDEARDKAGQLPQGNDYGETLSILSVLLSNGPLEVNKSVEPISQPQIHLIEGPNTLGTEVGDRIARGIYYILDSVLKNDKNIFNILAHSRGAVEAVLLAHEIQRIQKLCEAEVENPHFSQIIASTDAQNQSWWQWLGLTENHTAYSKMKNGPLADKFESLIKELKSNQTVADNFRNKMGQVCLNMYLLDPVPGGRLLPNTQWHDPRFMRIPENVREFNEVIYENERSRAFKSIIPEAVNPITTKTQYIPMPGNHGTGSGNHLDQKRTLLNTDSSEKGKLVKVTPLIQQLIIKQMMLFLKRNGVDQFRTQQEMKQALPDIHPVILETIYDKKTDKIYDDQILNEQILALYEIIYANKEAFKLLEKYHYYNEINTYLDAIGGEGSFHPYLGNTNPVCGRLVHGNQKYLERGVLPLQDIIPPVDGFINQDHQSRVLNVVYKEFEIQPDDKPAVQVEKIVQFMIKKSRNISSQPSPIASPSLDEIQQPSTEMYVACAKMHLSNLVDDYLNAKYSIEDRKTLIGAITTQLVQLQENVTTILAQPSQETSASFAVNIEKVFKTTLSDALQKKQQRLRVSLKGLKNRWEELPQALKTLQTQLESKIRDLAPGEKNKSQPNPLEQRLADLQVKLSEQLHTLSDALTQGPSETLSIPDELISTMNSVLDTINDEEFQCLETISDIKLLSELDDDLLFIGLYNTWSSVNELLGEFLETIRWFRNPTAITHDIESFAIDLRQLSIAQDSLVDYIEQQQDSIESLQADLQQLLSITQASFVVPAEFTNFSAPVNTDSNSSDETEEHQSDSDSESSYGLQDQSSLASSIEAQDNEDAISISVDPEIDTPAPSSELPAEFTNFSAPVNTDSNSLDETEEQQSDSESESSYELQDLFSLVPPIEAQDTEDAISISVDPEMKNPSPSTEVTDQGDDAVNPSDDSEDSVLIVPANEFNQAPQMPSNDLFDNQQNRRHSTSESTEMIFQQLVDNQLYPLTIQYRDHLKEFQAEEGTSRNVRSQSILTEKLRVVDELVNILSSVKENSASNNPLRHQHCVENFYRVLESHDNQVALKKHRDPQWGRFVRNAFAVVAILATGILPGMLVLACLSREKTRSMAFWKPRGAGFFDTAQKYRPEGFIDIADDQRGNRPDDVPPAAQF